VRGAFIATLTELARKDPRIVLVTGDLGFGVVTDFAAELPLQFVNAGVAEQNMTGLAAGMALSGKIVVTYSIANFPTLRCFEQIRNDVCAHHANVKIVSVGGGFAYGALGSSHHATEDLAVMRTLPNLIVVAPNDPVEARLATAAVLAHDGPCYLRLGRAGEPTVHSTTPFPPFALGRAIKTREGSDVTLIAGGGMLGTAMEAADELDHAGYGTRVLSMHTIKPLDRGALRAAALETSAIFTIEEHSIVGGLGSAVAELLLEEDHRPALFRRLGTPDATMHCVGDQQYLRKLAGLDSGTVAHRVLAALRHDHARSPRAAQPAIEHERVLPRTTDADGTTRERVPVRER
jgi:transketolase